MELLTQLWGSMAITGKVVVLVLFALSIYSYAVMVDRFLALRTDRQRSGAFVEGIDGESDASHILGAAREAVAEGRCSLGSVVAAGLDEYGSLRADDQPGAVVVEGVDEAVSRELDVAVINLRVRLSGMATISGVAPFLGLFGTVTGLIAAFRGIAETGSGGLATVPAGSPRPCDHGDRPLRRHPGPVGLQLLHEQDRRDGRGAGQCRHPGGEPRRPSRPASQRRLASKPRRSNLGWHGRSAS